MQSYRVYDKGMIDSYTTVERTGNSYFFFAFLLPPASFLSSTCTRIVSAGLQGLWMHTYLPLRTLAFTLLFSLVLLGRGRLWFRRGCEKAVESALLLCVEEFGELLRSFPDTLLAMLHVSEHRR